MTCKLFNALFDFTGSTEGTLVFKQNDVLTVVQPVDENWYFGCFNGFYGFIPRKYVKESEEKNNVYMKQCILSCIDKLQKIPEKKATKDEQSALKKLKKCLDALASESSTAAMAPSPPPSPGVKQQQQQQHQRKQKAPAPSPPKAACPTSATKPQLTVPKNLSRQLVEAVRASTHAPHQGCVKAVKRLLITLDSQLSEQSEELAEIIRQLAEQMMTATTEDYDSEPDSTMTDSRDWKAFDRLLSMAETRRRDWQERGGWSLHEQEGKVVDELCQLAELLTSSEPSVARRRIRLDGCAAPLCLAELHAAETRPAVRLGLIDCLSAMCALDRPVVDALLGHSSLATDLLAAAAAAAAASAGAAARDTADVLARSLALLAFIFSANIRPPNSVFEALTEKFFSVLLVQLAASGAADDDALAQSTVVFLLAANSLISEHATALAATPAHARPLFRALVSASAGCQVFTEALLRALNRGEDPAVLLDHSWPPSNTVLRMLSDLFAHEITAAVFYSGDIQVTLDVIVRELYNASPDSKKLPQLLQVLSGCVATSRYCSAPYKADDLRGALKQLMDQDSLPEPVQAQCRAVAQLLSKGGTV